MRPEIITFYEVCDASLKEKGFQDDPQVKMTTTEVFVTALVAAWFFASNLPMACDLLAQTGFVPQRRSFRPLLATATKHYAGRRAGHFDLAGPTFPRRDLRRRQWPARSLPQAAGGAKPLVSGRKQRLLGLLRREGRVFLWPQSPYHCCRKRASRGSVVALRLPREPNGPQRNASGPAAWF